MQTIASGWVYSSSSGRPRTPAAVLSVRMLAIRLPGWGGGCWTLGHYLDVCQQWIAQRGPLGLLRLALDGAGITRRQPAAPEGFAAARPIEKEIVL